MAMTLAEAEAQWRSMNPFPQQVCEDGVCRDTTQAEYDALATDGAQWHLDRVTRSETVTAAQAELAAAKPVYQKLKTGSATANETQRFLALIGKHVYRMLGEDAEAT